MRQDLLVLLASVAILFISWHCVDAYIPVSVMLPLNTVSNTGDLENPSLLFSQLKQLKSGGIDGVMTDAWWGIIEGNGPRQYNWTAYLQIANMCQSIGLNLQLVTSFHQCGTNQGDECYIPLPSWVLNVGNSDPDIFYRDSQHGVDQEYLSLGVDSLPLFAGRTPLEIYRDFMISMANTFANFMPHTIDQVQIGLGPAGEMRYPSYQLQDNKWTYCGIGEFQCYDKYMLANLSASATAVGHTDWGYSGPSDAGTYNSIPSQTGFFSGYTVDNFSSAYGQFFIGWYTNLLLEHGRNILSIAKQIFPSQVSIAAKVSGIHWWYGDNSHAAEVTAGYYNTNGNNAYLEIAQMLADVGAMFDFTCLEMTDSSNNCDSEPQQLVKQTILAARQAGVGYAGENALEICNPNCYQGGFDEIVTEATQYGPIAQFTYLRLHAGLLTGSNWQMFTNFVNTMHSN